MVKSKPSLDCLLENGSLGHKKRESRGCGMRTRWFLQCEERPKSVDEVVERLLAIRGLNPDTFFQTDLSLLRRYLDIAGLEEAARLMVRHILQGAPNSHRGGLRLRRHHIGGPAGSFPSKFELCQPGRGYPNSGSRVRHPQRSGGQGTGCPLDGGLGLWIPGCGCGAECPAARDGCSRDRSP